MTNNIYKTITFNKEVASVIEKYIQENNCTFNKAVNDMVKNYKKDIHNIKMGNEFKNINEQLKCINDKIDKLL